MNCIDCRYNLLKDGHYNCTYEEGECIKINVLEKENAELTCKMKRNIYCYSCANATERCFRNEIGCPCEKYKSYKDENAELDDFKSRVETVTDRFDKKSSQLTKAKEIIRELLNSCFGYNSKTVNYEVKVKAE